VGVTDVKGTFYQGDTLKVLAADGTMIAKGISSFSSAELKRVMGKNKKEISACCGSGMCSEVIHRDCLVVFTGSS